MRWERFDVAGIFGQTIAGIAAGGSTVLVWTGLALAWRRFWAWRELGWPQEVLRSASLREREPSHSEKL